MNPAMFASVIAPQPTKVPKGGAFESRGPVKSRDCRQNVIVDSMGYILGSYPNTKEEFMTRTIAALFALSVAAAPAFADGHSTGDAAAGEKVFNKCKACHMIVADDGTEIVKGGKTGPNLYGVIGRVAGSTPDFRYGDEIVKAGEAGLTWDEEKLAKFVHDPRGFLKETLDDAKAKSKMSFRLKEGGADVAAYLASVGPQS